MQRNIKPSQIALIKKTKENTCMYSIGLKQSLKQPPENSETRLPPKIDYPIFGVSNNNANFRLSGLIVLECPPYKYLLCPKSKCGKFPP